MQNSVFLSEEINVLLDLVFIEYLILASVTSFQAIFYKICHANKKSKRTSFETQ